MSLYNDVIILVDRLSLLEKMRLIEHLSAELKDDVEIEAFLKMPWHEFIERTAGILADDPIERPPQLPFEERDTIE